MLWHDTKIFSPLSSSHCVFKDEEDPLNGVNASFLWWELDSARNLLIGNDRQKKRIGLIPPPTACLDSDLYVATAKRHSYHELLHRRREIIGQQWQTSSLILLATLILRGKSQIMLAQCQIIDLALTFSPFSRFSFPGPKAKDSSSVTKPSPRQKDKN